MVASTRKRKLLTDFDRMGCAVRMRLLDHYNYSAKSIWSVMSQARWEFETLIPKIPYLGDFNIWQFNLDISAMNLALFRASQRQGFSFPEAVQLIHDIFEAYMHSFPKLLRQVNKWYFFSPFYQNRLRRGAAISQLRKYPGDWVFSYVEGNGSSFNAGVDIAECAILKFCHSQRAEALIPYLCKQDHALGKLPGVVFSHTGTLADGSPVCDCRWK